MKKNLYLLKNHAILILGEGVQNTMVPTYRNDFIINKGSGSRIEFNVLDINRKPVLLRGKRVKIQLIEDLTGQLYLEKDMNIIDYDDGRIVLFLSTEEVNDMEEGYYRYVLEIIDIDTGERFFLSNDNIFNAVGYIKVVGKTLSNPPDVQKSTNFMPFQMFIDNSLVVVYQSGIFKSNGSDLMTVAVTMTNFIGSVSIMGTISPSPPTDNSEWYQIPLNTTIWKNYDNFTGTDAFNITGNYNFFKFLYKPEINNTGKIEKVLFL